MTKLETFLLATLSQSPIANFPFQARKTQIQIWREEFESHLQGLNHTECLTTTHPRKAGTCPLRSKSTINSLYNTNYLLSVCSSLQHVAYAWISVTPSQHVQNLQPSPKCCHARPPKKGPPFCMQSSLRKQRQTPSVSSKPLFLHCYRFCLFSAVCM